MSHSSRSRELAEIDGHVLQIAGAIRERNLTAVRMEFAGFKLFYPQFLGDAAVQAANRHRTPGTLDSRFVVLLSALIYDQLANKMPDTPKKFANFAKFADEVVQAILHRLHCPLGRRYEWANWQDVELAVRDQI